MTTSRLATLALTGLLLGACGPNFTVEPLIGEDPAILALLEVSDTDLEVPETVASVERFYRALWTNQSSVTWSMLSRDTRGALDTLALTLDTNGRSLLQTRMFPRLNGKGTLKVSLAALFLVRRPIRFTQEAPPTPSDDAAVVIARNKMGETARVSLRRERGTWMIHHPEFKTLPPTVDLKPRLLPQDRRTKPVVPTAPEPADVEPTTPDIEPEEPEEPVEPTEPVEPGTEPVQPPRNPDLDF
jgi:hypothetical protein